MTINDSTVLAVSCGSGLLLAVIVASYMIRAQRRIVKTWEKYWGNNPGEQKSFEGTTTTPISLAAATCSHQWEVVKDERLDNGQQRKMITILQCPLCGTLDKTIESVNYIKPTEPRSECRHEWESKRSVTLDSAYEQIAENCPTKPGSLSKKENVPESGIVHEPWFFKKVYLTERVCSKCGEVRTTVISNCDNTDNIDKST